MIESRDKNGPWSAGTLNRGLTTTTRRSVIAVAELQPTLIEKHCTKCDTTKPVTKWSRNSRRRDGVGVWCKQCTSEYNKQRRKDPEVKQRLADKAAARYAAKTPEEKAAYIKQGVERRRKNAHNLRSKYGITQEQYESMLAAQGGGCSICGKEPDKSRRLCVDHDHACCPGEKTCGKCLRGLLCTTCNVWLGFYENADWMRRAGDYLKGPGTKSRGDHG